MNINFITPNLYHIPESHWNDRLKKSDINLSVVYGYPKNKDNIVVVSDYALLDHFMFDNSIFYFDESYKNTYGWIIESPVILEYFVPGYSDNVLGRLNKFVKIFTHNKRLLDISDKFVFYPHGDCWIENYTESNKNKLVSMISSEKDWVIGHRLRHKIIKDLRGMFDLYGKDYNPIDKKESGLNEYCYSIVVENCREDYYFTEKLVDCFRTKTIPIYWGCPSIGNFFDINGILTFSNTENLREILNKIKDGELYSKLKSSVVSNYIESLKYDTLFSHFHKLIN